jgi:hypothetical protein
MIDKLCRSQLIQGGYDYLGYECGMPMYGMYGGYYGNRDAVTLRGPLAYDEYGSAVKQKNKEHGFLKGLVAGVATLGVVALCLKKGKIRNGLTSVGSKIKSGANYCVNIFKKFKK